MCAWRLQMAAATRSSRHRGRRCQSQDWGQDRGRPPHSAHPSHRCAFLQLVQSLPRHRVGPFLGCSQSCSRAGHVDCFAGRLFLAPGLLPGMLGDQSHTEPPVSRAPGKQVTRLTCNPQGRPRGSAAEKSPRSTDPAQAPPLPNLDATVASHCLLPSPLTPLLVQLTAIFAG